MAATQRRVRVLFVDEILQAHGVFTLYGLAAADAVAVESMYWYFDAALF